MMNIYLVRHPTLLELGNTVGRNDEQTQGVISMGLHDKLFPLSDLKQYDVHVEGEQLQRLNYGVALLKGTPWMISTITAGTDEQIDCIIENSIFASLINLIKNTPCEILRAAWTMSGATCGSKSRQIKYLTPKGAIASLLESNNPSTLLLAMEECACGWFRQS